MIFSIHSSEYSQCDSFSLLGLRRYFLVQNRDKSNCRDKVYKESNVGALVARIDPGS